MIGVVDYGAGNLRSVYKALEHLGQECRVTNDPRDIDGFDGLVLPGVGAFSETMESLRRLDLIKPIVGFIESHRPFLGICLGLQVLMDESEETFGSSSETVKGLGVVRGRVRRFGNGLKVPQIGWNSIEFDPGVPLFDGLRQGDYVYFVHSYYVDPTDESVIACRSVYGTTFTAGIRQGNTYAVQFHPEKSGRVGLRMLSNFCRLVGGE